VERGRREREMRKAGGSGGEGRQGRDGTREGERGRGRTPPKVAYCLRKRSASAMNSFAWVWTLTSKDIVYNGQKREKKERESEERRREREREGRTVILVFRLFFLLHVHSFFLYEIAYWDFNILRCSS
jgi:hypothetical protein